MQPADLLASGTGGAGTRLRPARPVKADLAVGDVRISRISRQEGAPLTPVVE